MQTANTSLRPKRLRFALTLGSIALAGSLAILATPRAGDVEPAPAAALPAVEETEPVDPLWCLEAEPLERIGYRHGLRHVVEVVPLGPSAIEVEITTARAFLAMRAAALQAGVDLRLESGFRSVEEQRVLFQAWRKGRGNKAAKPGQSNHQSGRALDIAVNGEPGAFEWLEANAASFGFKRTVKTEPWHWEYVEVPVARAAVKRVVRKKVSRAKAIVHTKRPASRAKTSRRVASAR